MRKLLVLAIFLSSFICGFSQHPLKHWTDAIESRYSVTQPVISYLLRIEAGDTSSFSVEMKIKNIADTFSVAMVAHPEYDDKYWRYVNDITVTGKKGPGTVQRQDSSLWKIKTNGNEAVLKYKIDLPLSRDQFRSSWKAFLTPTGGLVGGPHSFMYIVGFTLAPAYVSVEIPGDWGIATGLLPTVDPTTFYAPSAFTLIDDPIFVGKMMSWQFEVDNVPHRVVYWALPAAKQFDTAKLVAGIKKIVEQTSGLFGRLPYRDYTFMLQDGAVGSLEHTNSVTVGAPASQLAQDAWSAMPEISHEYLHTWNLMRIHPVEYGDVSYKTPPLSKGLWFSEGLTIFFSDLLMRRAKLPVFDSTRIVHLKNLIRRYTQSPAYLKYSAEKISLASYAPIGMLGDYSGSTHLQGEVLGAMLDFIVLDATNGRKSMDDVIRKMLEKFSAEKGFTSADVEKTVEQVCGCSVHQFFQDHVFGMKQIDFDNWLKLIGLRSKVEWKDATSPDGKSTADLRVYVWQDPTEGFLRIGITNPASCWAKAGLHTGDKLISVNGNTIPTIRQFRQFTSGIKIGDTVTVDVDSPTGRKKAEVHVTGYQIPEVQINTVPLVTEKQKRLYEHWMNNGVFQVKD